MSDNRWRPVESGLPEYMRSCLVFCPDNENIYCAYYHFHNGSLDKERKPIWCFFDNDGRITEVRETVTHWMRLPKPPKI